MHVGLCLSTIDHNRHTRAEVRERVSRLREQFNLTSVELVLEGIGRTFAPYPWEWEEGELREVEAFLKPFQRTGAHLPFFAMNVISVNERVRNDAMEQMSQAIEIAKRLKLDYAVIHATGTTEGLMTAREPRRQHLAFTQLAALCQGSATTLSIENAHNLHEIKDCAEMIRTLRNQGLPVAMTFDTGHANIPHAGREAPYKHYGSVPDALAACIDVLGNIHLHNNDGSFDQHKGLLDGSMDLEACIRRLQDLDYQGSISIEARPQTQDVAEDISTLLEWIK